MSATRTSTDPRTERTRLALLRAAERLFAEHGVDGVSLRQIAREAGQKNHAAAEYHFGEKRELIEALLHRHSGPVDETFVPALDRLRAEGRETLEGIAAVLVEPMTAILDDPDGGPEYLLICAELVTHPTFTLTSLRAANGPGATELSMRMLPFLGEVDPILLPLRMMRVAAVLFWSLASYQRLRTAGMVIPRERFVDDLIMSLVALLAAPTTRR
jgi:AcrR family transcriptional regulator